jgi:P27 family predicted phage terminase small subunit
VRTIARLDDRQAYPENLGIRWANGTASERPIRFLARVSATFPSSWDRGGSLMPRVPKPLALKILSGNPGHRPLPTGEVRPEQMLHRCPTWLAGEARAFFQREVPRLFRLGLSTELDGAELVMLAQSYQRWQQAELAVGRSLEATGRLNRLRVVVAVRYAAQFRQLASDFGMSPSARVRISPGARDDSDDGFGILS